MKPNRAALQVTVDVNESGHLTKSGNRPGYGGLHSPEQCPRERNSMRGRIYFPWFRCSTKCNRACFRGRGETSAALFEAIASESALSARYG